ncbi:hypothetical protein Saro_2779 [Novosphingobium aromaticivorans DSM 12444]|uniref:DUF3617 domain-containing protein n=1 Tax=Novosphingobium aromaticivorans (strain ATCC 700278 / DSM 12444 / CCUG 56034 / CIP 105152 / NBRC 16084 / F199) TaxID=279238 RepID=Q2G4K8_NOVAD|nr:DUF3617 domain-containing protein [Novosphingobium aromaticivorans]ABD27215.1 hypothetical protein Saro_2779 [Novosphingobium aromaticivorans DSM 12444]SCY93655.1 Protein of unknown function [Novosphingobium aromaticivorans]
MRAAFVLVLPLMLAACGDDGSVEKKNASTAEVAKSVADAGMKLKPGRWELTTKFVRFDVEGMPPEAKKAMQQMLGQGHTFASCLTREEAEKPDGSFFGQESNDCRYDTFTMGGGKIDATMTCKGKGAETGNNATMKLAGTYSADTYDMTMDMTGAAPNGKSMTMQMALVSRRVGECKGDEQS